MTGWIDDEAEPADIILVGWNEKAALFGPGAAPAAWRGDAFNKPLVMFGRDGRDHDPVAGMRFVESPPVLLMRFTRFEQDAKDRLPFVGPAILYRALGAAPLETREEVGKVMATIAQAQSSPYQPTSARNSA